MESSRDRMMQRPNCYARTRTGYMPGVVRGRDENGMVVVETLDGKRQYSFPRDEVWGLEEAWRKIRKIRMDRVLGRYVFDEIMDRPLIVRCYNPEHPRRSDYVLARGRKGWTCTCPQFAQLGGCKHVDAYLELERLETPESLDTPAILTEALPHETQGQATLPLDEEPALAKAA